MTTRCHGSPREPCRARGTVAKEGNHLLIRRANICGWHPAPKPVFPQAMVIKVTQ